MVYDCFTYFTEKLQLLTRLHELKNLDVTHILVESAWTQSLQPKPYYFDQIKNDPEIKPFLDRIVHIKVDEKFEGSVWAHDIGQRNCITRGLDIVSPTESDVVMVSDVDEIPRAELLKQHIDNLPNDTFRTFQLGYFCYYLNLRVLDQQKNDFRWNGSVIVRPNILNKYTPHETIKLRDLVINQGGPNVVLDGGWHVSYLGKDTTYHKYKCCVEPADKINGIPLPEVFDKVWDEYAKPDGNFIFCDNLNNRSLGIRQCELSELPDYIQNNQEKYKQLIWRQ